MVKSATKKESKNFFEGNIEGDFRGKSMKDKPADELEENPKKEKEIEKEGDDELQLAEQIVQTYDLKESPEDVIEYLKSLEGKKNLKYQIASDHYGMKKLETERDYYKRLAEVSFSMPPNGMPASVNAVPVPRGSRDYHDSERNSLDSGSEADEDLIKYQRELANTWGPFMMMRDQFNPPAQNSGSGAADSSEIVDAMNRQSSAIAALAGQMSSGGQALEQAKSVIGLVKDVKEVLTESEDAKRKALEEETKRLQIAANKEKVAKLVDFAENYSGNSPPSAEGGSESEEADPYEYEYSQFRSREDRKFEEMFGSSRSGSDGRRGRSPKRR